MNFKKNKNEALNSRYETFLKLLRKNEDVLFAFTMRLLPNFSIAEDIMQETIMTMWQRFDSFQEGTNFVAWGKQIARYKVIEYIRKKGASTIHLSSGVIEELAQVKSGVSSYNAYFEALHSCLDKLKGRNREMMRLRYMQDMKVKDVATKLDMTRNALSKQMARIHHRLKQCIEQTISAWDVTNG